MLWVSWPEYGETWIMEDSEAIMKKVAKEIVDEFKMTEPAVGRSMINALAEQSWQGVSTAGRTISEKVSQDIRENRSTRHRLSAEHLPENNEGDKYYRAYIADGDRDEIRAPSCRDVLKTIGILRCAMNMR